MKGDRANIGKRLKPILMCPFCEHTTTWATDRKSMLEWHHHIKECEKKTDEEVIGEG
jgi:hypothetical protein